MRAWIVRLGFAFGTCTAFSAPPEFDLSASYRARFETLDNSFRLGNEGSDQLASHRFTAHSTARWTHAYAGIELVDSRAWNADRGTPLGTDDVNSAAILQAYVGASFGTLAHDSNALDIRAGRLTLDIGSRRYLARNGFRNTINAFSGIHSTWESKRARIDVFHAYPIDRRPRDRAALVNNHREADETNFDTAISGFDIQGIFTTGRTVYDFYTVRLQEKDGMLPTRDRQLYTAGLRRITTTRHWKISAEAAYQHGRSRVDTTQTTEPRLRHRAKFLHIEATRRLPRYPHVSVTLHYDFASGDKNANDGANRSYDTLFGARRFEFGPTGIYGALARANIHSPAIYLKYKRNIGPSIDLGYRAAWLAESEGALATAGLIDVSGASGEKIGDQIELRVRFQPHEPIRAELGIAYLHFGRFLKSVPSGPEGNGTRYAYGQLSVQF